MTSNMAKGIGHFAIRSEDMGNGFINEFDGFGLS